MITLTPSIPSSENITMANNFAPSSSQKSSRRVLADLTPNAQLTPKHLSHNEHSPVKTTPRQSPLKAQFVLSSPAMLLTGTKDALDLTSGSKKRPFSAMDAIETGNHCARSPMRQRPVMDGRTVSPAHLRVSDYSPVPLTTLSDDEESDEESIGAQDVAYHAHIDIPTHMAGGSFSSLVDYDPAELNNSSQDSPSTTTAVLPIKAMPVSVTSRVELLKLRLRMAMYKLNTNQTYLPFSQLQLPHERSYEAEEEEPEEQEDETQDCAVSNEASLNLENDHTTQNIVANITSGFVSKLGQGPVLLPTAYSSRFIETQTGNEPWSPALMARRRSLIEAMTPMASPNIRRQCDEKDLTSSVVKGHAASGLLELMNAR